MSALRVSSAVDDALARLPTDGNIAVVRDGPDTVIGLQPVDAVRAMGANAFPAIDGLRDGWWAGYCSYDLGRAVERVPDSNAPIADLADLYFVRFDTRIRIDGAGNVVVEGSGALGAAQPPGEVRPIRDWQSSLDRASWERAVGRVLRHLRDGDCYQVNLTRRLEAPERTDPVALFRRVVRDNPAPHAALLRLGDVAVVSASPECFLRIDDRAVTTRPIKGTSTDAVQLADSEKDRAENVMIVDLARNDLGRVCEYGSVHVPDLYAVEQHPGLYHLVSTVTGTLRADATLGDALRATFPPASVTGCPKPRVLQIIELLEPVRRGVYCGAVGFIDAGARVVDLNVAIRTFTLTPSSTSFGVGGGIVADSDPEAEWEETELKARRLLEIAGSV
ncbi:MAG TPA: anthranilate synthase component I family protein [Actinomycetota bacterium]|jgi:para-aminobenzoate synthetase component 1|nr:anthranilate synthase component I family protein [Actinomycetota bacterium]